MPRPPRLHVPGGCYHVILRGNHREDLFATPNDRAALNRKLPRNVDSLKLDFSQRRVDEEVKV